MWTFKVSSLYVLRMSIILLFIKLVIIIQVDVYKESELCNSPIRFIGVLLIAACCKSLYKEIGCR